MKISYSKYSAFLQNPERFRLSYMLGLSVEGDETPTFMNLGRRRGRCFHAIIEGRKTGTLDRDALCQEHTTELVERCERMTEALPDLGDFLLTEESFIVPIGDGKHEINGRLDHIFLDDGQKCVGDFKTTKGTRTKKEAAEYFAELETSPQPHFYLHAAPTFGHATDLFKYHVILDRKDKDSKPQYVPIPLHIGPAEVARVMAGVYAACEAIEGLIERVGIDKPWPHSNHWPCRGDKFFCGFSGICGRQIPKGCAPGGFTYRWKEKIQSEAI